MSKKFYDYDDFDMDCEVMPRHKSKGSRKGGSSEREQAKRAEKNRRAAAKFEANAACISEHGKSIKEMKKEQQRREQARSRRFASDE